MLNQIMKKSGNTISGHFREFKMKFKTIGPVILTINDCKKRHFVKTPSRRQFLMPFSFSDIRLK